MNSYSSTKKLENKIGSFYTHLLHNVLNISWKEHITNEKLYADFKSLSKTITG